jgi:hypothetical protein
LPPTYPTELFASQAEYDEMVADVCRRVASGEIKPRDLQQADMKLDVLLDILAGLAGKSYPAAAPTTTGEGKEVVGE